MAGTASADAAMEEEAVDGAASPGGGEEMAATAAQAAVASEPFDEPELGEPELFGLRESFVSLCLAHHQRQGVHGHALLQKLLGAMSALIEQSQSSRLGWLRTHFLDVVVQRIEPVQPLPPVEKNSPEYGRMLESLTKLEDELLAAHDAAHESTLKHEGLLSKVSKKQKEYAAALDELLASEEENEPLKLKVQQLTLEVSRHRQVIDDATDPLPPPPVTQPPITQPPITPSPGTPAAGTSAANLASASGGAGAASSASSASASAVAGGSGELSFMGKVAAIKDAFGLGAAMQAMPAIERAKQIIGLDTGGAGRIHKGGAAATLIMQFLDTIARIRREFELPSDMMPSDVIEKANAVLGLPAQTGTLVEQAETIMDMVS